MKKTLPAEIVKTKIITKEKTEEGNEEFNNYLPLDCMSSTDFFSTFFVCFSTETSDAENI